MATVRIPADVEREDRVLAGLSARQLAVLAAGAVAVWLGYVGARALLPVPVAAALVAPLAGFALVVALGRRDGLSGERFALAALAHHRAPRRRVLAPEGVVPPPSWLPVPAGERPGILDFPARNVTASSVVDLGDAGSVLVCTASSVNFSLRSEGEQEALVAAFGRLLHALSSPVQVVARAEPADLAATVAAVEHAVVDLPHPGLRQAALEHAAFLSSLSARRDVLRRDLFVVLADPRPPAEAEEALLRLAEEAASLLVAAGVSLSVAGADEVAAILSRLGDPDAGAAEGRALPGAVVERAGP